MSSPFGRRATKREPDGPQTEVKGEPKQIQMETKLEKKYDRNRNQVDFEPITKLFN